MLFRDEILPEREDFLFVMGVVVYGWRLLLNVEYLEFLCVLTLLYCVVVARNDST